MKNQQLSPIKNPLAIPSHLNRQNDLDDLF
jgi:hypothetical protein